MNAQNPPRTRKGLANLRAYSAASRGIEALPLLALCRRLAGDLSRCLARRLARLLLSLRPAAPRGLRRVRLLRRGCLAALGEVLHQRLQIVLHPAHLVPLGLAGRQLAVLHAHARAAARRLELDD